MNLRQSLITAALLLGAGPLLLGASPPAGAELQLTLPEAYPAYRQLSFAQSFTQDGGGDGPIFEDSSDSDFNLFEYLDINAIAGASSGSSISRTFSYLRLGGQYSTGNLSFYGNILASNVTSEINLELDENAQYERQLCMNPRDHDQFLHPDDYIEAGIGRPWMPGEREAEIARLEAEDFDNHNCDQRLDQQEKMTYEFELSRSAIDELYLNYSPLDTVSLTAGYNRLTLGQFAFVSPIHLLVPINSEQQIGFSKVDTRVPQPLLQVDFYPIERLQLQAVLIPQSKLDPAQEEYFDSSYRGIGSSYNPVAQLDLRWRGDYDDSQDATEVFAGHQQTLFRALYSPSWGSVGVTAWTGGLHFFIIDNLQIFCGDGSQHYCEDAVDSMGGDGSNPYGYYAEAAPDLAESDAFALEIAYNVGNWTYIAELVQVQTRSEFSIFNPSASILRGDEEEMRDAQSFFKTLAELNQGRTWFDLNYTLLAVGADGRSSDGSWTYNLEVFNIATDLKEGDDLLSALGSLPNSFNESWENDQRGKYDDLFFPSFHISKRHTSILGRQADFGVALGFFFQFGGIFSYYNLEVNDNFNVQLALEFIERISENDAATDDNRDYDLVDSMSSAFSVAAQIRF